MLFLACTVAGLDTVFGLLRAVLNLIRIFVPILLLIFGTLDLAKAIIAGKEDEMKKFQSALIKRILYAAVVFLIPTFVLFITDFLATNGVDEANSNWKDCLQKSAYVEETNVNENSDIDI